MTDDPEKSKKSKERYPWYIIFILANEFCERFTYYGMKTVLTLFFAKVLLWSDDTTTFFYHLFSLLCYFFPIFGALLADGYIGPFWTILSLSIVYILGLVILTLSAIPLQIHAIAACLSGLLLIAIGTGGIKPCVSTYGANQFKPGQEKHRESFFSYFYCCINAGSLISTFVTPILRSDVQCYGEKTCYPLAFGVPAVLMAIALALFLFGKPFYTDSKPSGSLISRVCCCIGRAIYNNVRGINQVQKGPDVVHFTKDKRRESQLSLIQKFKNRWAGAGSSKHWLDSASDNYDQAFIEDVKQLLRVLVMFIPIPFWALFDQQGSRWTLQASRMDGRLTETYYFQPDQVQIFNPALILILVPIFDLGLYPLMEKCKIPFRMLARMVCGMVLAGAAFIIAAFVQIALEKTLPTLPQSNHVDLYFLNTNPCSLTLQADFYPLNSTDSTLLAPYDSMSFKGMPVVSGPAFIRVDTKQCPQLASSPTGSSVTQLPINVQGGKSYAVMLYGSGTQLLLKQIEVDKSKPEDGNTRVQFVAPFLSNSSLTGVNLTLIDDTYPPEKEQYRTVLFINSSSADSGLPSVEATVQQGKFLVYISDPDLESGQRLLTTKKLDLPNGGVYTIILRDNATANETQPWDSHTIVEANSLSIFWQFPQYFVITVAEVLLSVSGLSFAYSEAPESMRSVLQAAWLLTSAFGSVIVMIFSGAHLIQRQADEFFVFAGLIGVFSIIFAIMCKYYKYRETSDLGMEMIDQKPAIKMDTVPEEDEDSAEESPKLK